MHNRMTDLINKIERRLGTAPLNLPENLKKDKWAQVIIEDSITTFSMYFPNQIRVDIDPSIRTKDGYCYIDRELPENIEILGVRDLDWHEFSNDSFVQQQTSGFGIYDMLANGYGIEDTMLMQMRADTLSIYNNGFYVDFKPPNMIKIVSVTGADIIKSMRTYPVLLYIKHAPNLMTISPTKMETFERLALADVATFLYEYLKHYDGLETVFANVNLQLDTISRKAEERDNVIEEMKNAYVGAANDYAPLIMTI